MHNADIILKAFWQPEIAGMTRTMTTQRTEKSERSKLPSLGFLVIWELGLRDEVPDCKEISLWTSRLSTSLEFKGKISLPTA